QEVAHGPGRAHPRLAPAIHGRRRADHRRLSGRGIRSARGGHPRRLQEISQAPGLARPGEERAQVVEQGPRDFLRVRRLHEGQAVRVDLSYIIRDNPRRKAVLKKLHHNAYRCRDSEETRRFYEGFLGLPLAATLEITETKSGRPTRTLHTFY